MPRPHLPSLVLGALLGTAGLAIAQPGAPHPGAVPRDATAVAIQGHVATLRALASTLPDRVRVPFLDTTARLEADVHTLLAGHDAHDARLHALRARLAEQTARADAMAMELATCAAGPMVAAPIPRDRWARIVQAVTDEAFADAQLARLKDAVGDQPVTAAQVVAILGAFAFDETKVEAAAWLFPRVIDREQWFTVYDALTFGSSKEALRARTTGTAR